jgi:hypothetical protein
MTATRRKPQPQQPRNAPTVDPALALLAELVSLQRETNEHLAAIRQQGELSIPETSFGTEPKLIDPDDLLTVQQASGLAVRDEKTIRRWLRYFEISIVLGGTLFIRKSKLLAHLAHTKRSVD